MLTPEMVKEALQTSHDACDGPLGCIHADALSGATEDLKLAIVTIGMAAMGAPSPLEFTIFTAIHIGYRLRELEEAGPTKKVLVN